MKKRVTPTKTTSDDERATSAETPNGFKRADDDDIDQLRRAVRFFYDLQKLRIATGGRAKPKAEGAEVQLRPEDKLWCETTGAVLHQLELDARREIRRLIPLWPISDWLMEQRGIAEGLTAVLLSEVDIARAPTVSALWRYAGLAVVDGHRERPVKGVKLKYNAWLKSKMYLLGDCMVKCNSPWRKFYDDYKHRKQTMLVQVCMNCQGTGKAKYKVKVKVVDPVTKEEKEKEQEKEGKCKNCNGTGGPAPWGKSDLHRNMAANRYMVKMFLMELWKRWRELEGLPTPAPYAEAWKDRIHGDHGGVAAE